jgi:hypothetical protein
MTDVSLAWTSVPAGHRVRSFVLASQPASQPASWGATAACPLWRDSRERLDPSPGAALSSSGAGGEITCATLGWWMGSTALRARSSGSRAPRDWLAIPRQGWGYTISYIQVHTAWSLACQGCLSAQQQQQQQQQRLGSVCMGRGDGVMWFRGVGFV